MDAVSLAIALKAAGKTAEQVKAALDEYLEENPEALDQAAVEAIVGEALAVMDGELDQVKSAIQDLEAGSLSAVDANTGQVPTADGEGSWSWQTPSSGGGDVTDVQVNGVSVLDQDGVANVPAAGNQTYGVIKVRGYGLAVRNDGFLAVEGSSKYGGIKPGTELYCPIVPFSQDYATFYGLAKIAGLDEKNSTLPAGQYTDAAKSAIQTMLGISGIIASVEGTTASKAYAIGDAFLHGGALYKASAAITAGDAIVPGTNCTQTTIIEMMKGA